MYLKYTSTDNKITAEVVNDNEIIMKYLNGLYENIVVVEKLEKNMESGIYYETSTQTVYKLTITQIAQDDIVEIIISRTKLGAFTKIERIEEKIIEDVKTNPTNIRYIEQQTEAICWAALNKQPSTIEYIKSPTYDMKKFSVNTNPSNIKFIKDQPEDLCWIAIKKEMWNLQYIKNPTKEMCIFVLQSRPQYLTLLNQTEEMQMIVASQGSLEGIKNPSEKVILTALKNCDPQDMSLILNKIPDYHVEICRAVLDKNYKSIRFLRNQSVDIQKYAIDVNFHAFEHISNPSEEIKKYACDKYLNHLQMTKKD